MIATCAGQVCDEANARRCSWSYSASCLVLDPIGRRWDQRRMGDLTMIRYLSAVVSLRYVGVFVIGGMRHNYQTLKAWRQDEAGRRTIDYLAPGSMEWQEGPALPAIMDQQDHPCAVALTHSTFIAIYGNNILEFNAAIAGPTSNDGWQEAGKWPQLKIRRSQNPGCARIGQKVVISGGYRHKPSPGSTEVLDLVSRNISSVDEMVMPRSHFHVVTISVEGEVKMFGLGGFDCIYWRGGYTDMVVEWAENSSTWKAAASLASRRGYFGVVAAPRQLICPKDDSLE